MSIARNDATTSELRHDWLADRWVIIAPQRTERPFDFVHYVDVPNEIVQCPFCWGCESSTPEAVAKYVRADARPSDKWSVRVVPNKFPAVQGRPIISSAADEEPNGSVDRIDLFKRRELNGGHEVIVESPLHLNSISQLALEEVHLVFRAYRDRLRYWLHERKACYAVVFKNVGQDAGASLVHTHSQLIATDLLPPDVLRATERMQLFKQKEDACLFCRMVDDEIQQEDRIVEQTTDFLAFCPFASRLPALITIVPVVHESHFETLDDGKLKQVAWLTHRMVRRIEKCYPQAAYNFVIHTVPGCQEGGEYFHWRLELFPRLTKVAGFEWGSDCYINPLAPEDAAENLRSAGV
ncbi:MAG: DUF4921 family protein [Planctomycetales bacterium]|nr:DUF4921 family protein [Planctomycetales bacterium]